MNFTVSFTWWALPTAITVLALLWAFFWPADDGGFMGGITRLFMLVPALLVTAVAWALAGIFLK
jgi:hypothetical protein